MKLTRMKNMAHAAPSSACFVRLLAGLAWAISAATAADGFASPLAQADLDPHAFAEWMEGKEIAIGHDRRPEGPAWVVWTSDSQAGWYGQDFGDGKIPGPRHMRIGFTRAIAVGTILACAETLSVLKPGATYPGDLG